MPAKSAYRLAMSVLYNSGATSAALWRQRRRRGALILCYHGVEEPSAKSFVANGGLFVTPSSFERQLRFVKRNFPIVPLGQVVRMLGEKASFDGTVAVVTFDDGYRNTLTNAYPILKQYDIPATVFLATGYVGNHRRVWWEEAEALIGKAAGTVEFHHDNSVAQYDLAMLHEKGRLFRDIRKTALSLPPDELDQYMNGVRHVLGVDDVDQDRTFLSWDEVRTLSGDGLIEFGSHTVTHCTATRVPQSVITEELEESKAAVEGALGSEISAFAYPYGQRGDYSAHIGQLIRKSGYSCALTADGYGVSPVSDPFQLSRIPVSGGDSFATFASKLAGIDGLIRPAARFLLSRKKSSGY